MQFRAEVTLSGYVEFEAESLEDAKARMEDGFSIDEFECIDTDVEDIYELKETIA